MKAGIAIVILILLAAGAYLIFHKKAGEGDEAACAERMPRIVAFGDSLVAGKGADTDGGFVTLLSREAGVAITNLGISGNTTADALGRLNEVSQAEPDITLVLLGGNDALQRIPQATTEQNLGQIISAIRQGGSKVVLLGVLGGFPQDPYAPMFERLSKTYGVTYVPNVLSGLIGHPSLMSDDVHPDQAGYQRIADRVLPVLERACAQ